MMNHTSESRRVVVTGMGAICGLGHNLSDIWKGVVEGRSGVRPLKNIHDANLPVTFGGQVQDYQVAEELIPAKDQGRYDKFIHYAIGATAEALKHSQQSPRLSYPAERVGCIMGVGMGGFPFIEETYRTYIERGPKRIGPFFIPSVIPNMTSGLVSLLFSTRGVNYSISSACASSAHAIGAAATEILLGKQDMMITGGSEAVISILPISGFSSMKALSKRNDDPAKASRPFDVHRDGFVIGEGAGVLILERLDKAIERGATIYAEIVGFAANSDAYHITAPHPEGEGASACMTMALSHAGLSPEQIDYVNAHGTSTPLGDIAETKALKKTFGPHAYNLSISSTKSMTGHLLGAAGGLESIFCVKAINEGIIPPTINLEEQDKECDLNYTPNRFVKKEIQYALNNSFGFGGTNSSLIFKRYNK